MRNHAALMLLTPDHESDHAAPTPAAPANRAIPLLLCTALLAGAALRIRQLDRLSLWWDEAFSVGLASRTPSAIINESFTADFSPPLYYLILHGWISLAGAGEAAVRLLSTLFGIAAIYVIYRLGALLFDRRTGALAAWMLALSAFHVEYSQETRAYTLMLLLALLSMLACARLRTGARGPAATTYLLATAALIYTHIYGIFILFAQLLHFLLAPRSARANTGITWRGWITLHLTLALLTAPIALLVLSRIGDATRDGFWLPRPTLGTLKLSLTSYAGSPLLLRFLLPLAAAGAILTLGSQPAAATAASTRAPFLSPIFRSTLLLTWLTLPLGLPFLISQVSLPMYHTRYAIAVLPALLLLAAAGMTSFPARPLRPFLITAVLALSLSATLQHLATATKEPWRDIVAHIDAHALPGDTLLADRPELINDIFHYYSKRNDLRYLLCEILPPGMPESDQPRFTAALATRPRIWHLRCRSHDHRRDLPFLIEKTHSRINTNPTWLPRRIEVTLYEP